MSRFFIYVQDDTSLQLMLAARSFIVKAWCMQDELWRSLLEGEILFECYTYTVNIMTLLTMISSSFPQNIETL